MATEPTEPTRPDAAAEQGMTWVMWWWLIAFLAAVVFGVVAFGNLAVDLLPDISYPSISVRTELTGAAPIEIESLVTKPIEDAVGSLVVEVATVAGDRPVLMVVFDGLSLPVAGHLHTDLEHHGWAEVLPQTRASWPVVVAALPTVTEVSRASLLAGRRTSGGQQVERDGFRTHPALRALGGPDPVLYHKADLTGPGGNALPEAVRATVASPATRFVAPANFLSKIRLGVRAIERQTDALTPYVTSVNDGLGAIRDGLKTVEANLTGLVASVSRQAARGRP